MAVGIILEKIHVFFVEIAEFGVFFCIFVHDLCFKLQNAFCFPRQCVSDCIATVSFNTAQLGCPACNISTKYQKNSY